MNDVMTGNPPDEVGAALNALIIEPNPQNTQNQGERAEPQPDTAAKPEEEPVTQESEGVDEGEATESEGGEPEAEESDPDAQEAETESAKEPEGKYNITLPDGTTQKVSFGELREGYLRQSDYTRKTAELSEQRKGFETETETFRQHKVSVLSALSDRLQQLDPISMLQSQLRQADEIGDTETANALRFQILEAKEEQRNIANALRFEQEQEAAGKTQKEQEEIASHLQSQQKALFEKLPLLSSEKGQKEFHDSVAKAMKKVGLTPDDVGARPDHRNAMLAYYAGKYLAGLEAKPQVAEALKGKAVMPKPGVRSQGAGNSARDAASRQLQANPQDDGALGRLLASYGV